MRKLTPAETHAFMKRVKERGTPIGKRPPSEIDQIKAQVEKQMREKNANAHHKSKGAKQRRS